MICYIQLEYSVSAHKYVNWLWLFNNSWKNSSGNYTTVLWSLSGLHVDASKKRKQLETSHLEQLFELLATCAYIDLIFNTSSHCCDATTENEKKHNRTPLKSCCFSFGKVMEFSPGCVLCGGGRAKAVIHTTEGVGGVIIVQLSVLVLKSGSKLTLSCSFLTCLWVPANKEMCSGCSGFSAFSAGVTPQPLAAGLEINSLTVCSWNLIKDKCDIDQAISLLLWAVCGRWRFVPGEGGIGLWGKSVIQLLELKGINGHMTVNYVTIKLLLNYM